jgi:hypothetical protein
MLTAPPRNALAANRLLYLAADLDRVLESVGAIPELDEGRAVAFALAEVVESVAPGASELAKRLRRCAGATVDEPAAEEARRIARTLDDVSAVALGLAADIRGE